MVGKKLIAVTNDTLQLIYLCSVCRAAFFKILTDTLCQNLGTVFPIYCHVLHRSLNIMSNMHFRNGLCCTKHCHGATCSVDSILDVYYYGVHKVNSQLYNENNPFLNCVANACLRRDATDSVDCAIREEPWNWLVANSYSAFGPKGTSYAEIVPGFRLLGSDSGRKFVPFYKAQLSCNTCNIDIPHEAHLDPVTCILQSGNIRNGGHLFDIVQDSLQTQALSSISSFDCHQCQNPCVLNSGCIETPDFFMLHIPLNDYKNVQHPALIVTENASLFGQNFKLTAAVQMLPQHFLSIVYHQGKYVVLDDMHADVGTYDTFAGAAYRDNSLSQLCCPLTKEHGGIHMLIYSRNVERMSFTPPPSPNNITVPITPPLPPTNTNVASSLPCHVVSPSVNSPTPATESDSPHTPPNRNTLTITQAEQDSDCKTPFAPQCTSTPHTTSNSNSSHTLDCTSTPDHSSSTSLPVDIHGKVNVFGHDLPVRLLGKHIYFAFKQAMELAGQQNKINKHGYIAIDKLLKGHDVQSEAAFLSKGKRRQWIGKDCLIKILSDKTLRGNPQRSALVLLLNQITPKSVKNSVTQSECSVKTTGVGHKMEGMCRGSNASAHESANVNTDAANLSSTCDAKPKTQATSFTQNRFILGQNVAIKIVGSALYFSFKESMLLAGQHSKIDKHGYSRIDKIFKSLAIAPEEAFLMKGRRRQWIEKKSYIRFLMEPRVKPNHVDPALIILINRITIATMRPKGQSQSDVSQELAADAPNSRDTTISVSADTVSVDSTDVPKPVNHSVTSMDSMDSVQSTAESGDPAYLVSKAGVDSSQLCSADTVSVDSTDVPEPVNHSVTSMDSMDSVQSTAESGDPACLVSKAGVDSSQLRSADTVSVDSTDVPEPVNHSVTSMDSMDSVQSTAESGDPAYLVSKAGVDSSQLRSADTVSVDSTDVPEPVNHSVTSMDSMDSVQSTAESGDPAYLVSKAGVDSSQLRSADTVSVDSTDVPEPVNHSVTSMDSMDSVQSTAESGDPACLVSKAGVDSSQLRSADTVSVDSTDVPEPVNHSVTSMDSMDSVQSTAESGDPAYLVSKAGVDSSQLRSADAVSVDSTDVPEPVNHSVTSMDSMDSVQSTAESGDPACLVSKAGVDSSQLRSADTVSVDSTDVPEPVNHSVTSMDSMDSVQSTVESGDPAYLVSKAGVDSSQLRSADAVSVDSTDVPEPVNHSVTSMDSMDSTGFCTEGHIPEGVVHLLDKSVPYLWLNGKLYVETKDLFSELEWDASLRKNSDRYILPYLSKKGLTPDSYQKLGNTRYISLIALIRILDWKVGSKPKKSEIERWNSCRLGGISFQK